MVNKRLTLTLILCQPPVLDSIGGPPRDDAKPTDAPKSAGGPRAPAISIYTVDANGSTIVEHTARAGSPSRIRMSGGAESSPSKEALHSPSPPRSPGNRPPASTSSKKAIALPKLRLEAIKAEAAADEPPKASSAANRLVTIQEDTELAASAPNSPHSDRPHHFHTQSSAETTESDEEFDYEPDDESSGGMRTRPRSPSVAVTDAERASITRPRSPSVSVPKRPILNLEDMKKLVRTYR